MILMLVVLITVSTAEAVIITGTGKTETEAINNGLREAVEMYTGSLVYAVTDVIGYQIQKDQIVATSLGHIKSYRIVRIVSMDDMILATLDVKLSEEKIESVMRENVNIITVDDVLKDYNNVYKRQEQMKKLRQMLIIMSERPIHEKYSVTYTGYEIKRVSPDVVDTVISFRLSVNPFFARAYREVLKNLSEPKYVSRENWAVGRNYRLEFGKLVNETYFIPSQPDIIDDIKVFVTINGQRAGKTYRLRDNLIVVYSTAEFVKFFVTCFPKHFKEAYDGKEIKIDKKWNNRGIKSSIIIPEEGLLLKVKYRVTDPEQIKHLATLKLGLQVVGKD